jgi:hypothetical protein
LNSEPIEAKLGALEAFQDGRKSYSFTLSARGRNLFFAAIFAFNAWMWFGKILAHSWENVLGQWLFGVVFALGLANYCRAAVQSKVLADRDSITVTSLFGTCSLRRNEIKGRRKVTSRMGADLLLDAADSGQKSLLIIDGYNFDPEWNDWVHGLVDLDAKDKEERLRKLTMEMAEQGDNLVSGAERRLATWVMGVLTTVAIAAGLAVWFAQDLLDTRLLQALSLFLVFLPWITLAIIYRWPRLYALTKKPDDPRTQLGALVFIPCMAFSLGTNETGAVVTPLLLLGVALVPASILAWAEFRAIPKGFGRTRPQFAMALLPIFLLVYGWWACFELDTIFDRSVIGNYSSIVLQSTDRSNDLFSHYVRLSPWEGENGVQEFRVSNDFYDSVKAGDAVCVTEHRGTLRVPWYDVHHCQ